MNNFYINLKKLPKDYKTNKDFHDKIHEQSVQRYIEKVELMPYQAELIKLQDHIEKYNKKMIILCDGRDASGKGGTIRRITRYMNEKHYRVVSLGKPSKKQKTELHIKRYIEQFPHAGEIVLFDRSWYNRAMVEPIFGFCTQSQYKKFLKHVNSYEENFLEDEKTILLKLYFSVSKDEQNRRFERRKNDPLRQWKLSEVDLQAQELWDEFTEKKYKMLVKTSTELAPWHIIRSDDKHQARRQTIKLLLNSVRYRNRNKKLNYKINQKTVISAKEEIKIMKKQRKKYGKFIR
jgi:polyphosphate kinase 2